jgi:hypothetical protein
MKTKTLLVIFATVHGQSALIAAFLTACIDP